MKNWILGINPCVNYMNYHDPAVVLLNENKIIAGIEEERINGIKNSVGIFPQYSIKECLKIANINIDNITTVAIGYSPESSLIRTSVEMMRLIKNSNLSDISEKIINGNLIDGDVSKKFLIDINYGIADILNRHKLFEDEDDLKNYVANFVGNKNVEVKFYDHHMAHAASAFYTSSFDEAIGIVIDGVGEYSSTSIWKITEKEFSKVLDLPMPNSIGYFYAAATAFLGFKPFSGEGKLMALAPYGKMNIEILESLNKIIDTSKDIYNVKEFVSSNFGDYLMLDIEKAIASLSEVLGTRPRRENEEIISYHKDFAFVVQYILEKAVLNLVNYGINLTGINNVCAAGGVFLNCKMNMIIREESMAKDFFVQPIASDAGLALGSALLVEKKHLKNGFKTLALGTSYSNDDIEMILKECNLECKKSSNITKETAILLSEGKIVCWFNGRMEMGARALGSRSILADPRKKDVSDFINKFIKHREKWRPFACSIIKERAGDILLNYVDGKDYPFMIEAFKVKDEWINEIPAVIHCADNTTRPQLVSKDTLPIYYQLINEFFNITGIPLLLNTSFNDKGQPIIMTPKESIKFYFSNPVDVLVMGDYIINSKKRSV